MTQTSLSSNAHPHGVKHEPTPVASKYDANPSGIVVGLTLSLSWQLALAVLVPILGGHYLDDHFKTGMWLTVIGFALAMISMVVIIRRTLAQLNEYMKASDTPDAQKDEKK